MLKWILVGLFTSILSLHAVTVTFTSSIGKTKTHIDPGAPPHQFPRKDMVLDSGETTMILDRSKDGETVTFIGNWEYKSGDSWIPLSDISPHELKKNEPQYTIRCTTKPADPFSISSK